MFIPPLIELPPLPPPRWVVPLGHADAIPYESFRVPEGRNKNIMEYNTLRMDELIREGNQRIIDEVFRRELEESRGY